MVFGNKSHHSVFSILFLAVVFPLQNLVILSLQKCQILENAAFLYVTLN